MARGKRYGINDQWACTKCGKLDSFGPYVAAHWGVLLVHTCECGQSHEVIRGYVMPIKEKKRGNSK